MIRKFSFEITAIVAALLVLIAVVGASGLLAYRSLRAIVDSASRKGPGEKLLLLKEITSDLSNADNSVHSYTLVKEERYIEPFYSSLTSVDEKMNRLYTLEGGLAPSLKTLDSLDTLITAKYTILRKFLTLHNDKTIVDGLGEMAGRLDKPATENAAPQQEIPTQKKSTLFKRIFGGKEKTNDRSEKDAKTGQNTGESRSTSTLIPGEKRSPGNKDVIDVKQVKGALLKMKQEQLRRQQEINAQELQYTREDKEVSDRIRALIGRMEKKEIDAISARAKESGEQVGETNRIIAIFCAVAAALLIIMGMVIARYIRKSRAYSFALKNAKTEAENLARAKENFFVAMSHEIRTPMNAISGFTEHLLQAASDEEQKTQLRIIKKSSDHLLGIINEVLDYAQLQAGKIRLQSNTFSPAETIHEIIQLLSPLAEKKKLRFHADIESNVPGAVSGDELRLKQVLLNLAGNAIKFTEKGTVKISASSLLTGKEEIEFVIKVRDTGIGIDSKELGKIFDMFEQADNIPKKYGGTGLGLSITKRLVELQGGRIAMESEAGTGTEVTVTIPYRVAQKRVTENPTENEMEMGLLENYSVLVVDDEEYNRMLLSVILKKWGVHCTEACSGTEAIEKAELGNFDAILMDLRMAGADGVETTRRIREKMSAEKPRIPVIALTAAATGADMQRCREAGLDDFLIKPFREKELYSRLVNAIKPKPRAQAGTHKPAPTAAAEIKNEKHGEKNKKYSLDELERIASGDEKFLKEMISTFIVSTREGIKAIRQHTEEKNWDQVAHYAHRIASPCRHLQVSEMLTLLLAIEQMARGGRETEDIPALVEKLEAEEKAVLPRLERELDKIKI